MAGQSFICDALPTTGLKDCIYIVDGVTWYWDDNSLVFAILSGDEVDLTPLEELTEELTVTTEELTGDALTIEQRVFILEGLINRIVIEFQSQGFKLKDEVLITQFETAIKLITK